MKKKIFITAIITGLTALVGLGAILGTKTAFKESKAVGYNETYNQVIVNYYDMDYRFLNYIYDKYIEGDIVFSSSTYTSVNTITYYISGNANYNATATGNKYLMYYDNLGATNPFYSLSFKFNNLASSNATESISLIFPKTLFTEGEYLTQNDRIYYKAIHNSNSYNGSFTFLFTESNNDMFGIYDYFYGVYEDSENNGNGGQGEVIIVNPFETESYTFTFAYQINYYALYNSNIDNMFINDNTFDIGSLPQSKVLFEGVQFTSGGQTFDTIRLWYQNAQALSYLDSNKNRQTWTASGFASFIYMEYFNSTTNKIEVVNTRLTKEYQNGNTTGIDQERGSIWVSSPYQTLTFAEPLTEEQITQLARLNNANIYGNTYIGNNGDIGLGSTFTLLGQAFTSWTGLLSIQVLPNITLGLLIFLPMIVGIIILIVWIVKR